MYFKIFFECFILTNETKIPFNGLVLGACCIFSIAITVVNNFNFTWYKIAIVDISCKIREYTSSFINSIALTKLYLPTSQRFCIGTLTYNALLPVQHLFSPFWNRRKKFQRTIKRCHHTEYERVCPVKLWYYNNLITNQQNTLIIDKHTTKTAPNEV